MIFGWSFGDKRPGCRKHGRKIVVYKRARQLRSLPLRLSTLVEIAEYSDLEFEKEREREDIPGLDTSEMTTTKRKYLGGSGNALTVWISLAASTVLVFYGYDQVSP